MLTSFSENEGPLVGRWDSFLLPGAHRSFPGRETVSFPPPEESVSIVPPAETIRNGHFCRPPGCAAFLLILPGSRKLPMGFTERSLRSRLPLRSSPCFHPRRMERRRGVHIHKMVCVFCLSKGKALRPLRARRFNSFFHPRTEKANFKGRTGDPGAGRASPRGGRFPKPGGLCSRWGRRKPGLPHSSRSGCRSPSLPRRSSVPFPPPFSP